MTGVVSTCPTGVTVTLSGRSSLGVGVAVALGEGDGVLVGTRLGVAVGVKVGTAVWPDGVAVGDTGVQATSVMVTASKVMLPALPIVCLTAAWRQMVTSDASGLDCQEVSPANTGRSLLTPPYNRVGAVGSYPLLHR